MYQSVMAKRQGTGSSGVGFAFVLAEIKELRPELNICLAMDLQTGDYYQVGLNKRGETAWPQVGDRWILDRSLGHWALQGKVTDVEPPAFTGNLRTMNPDVLRLAGILHGLGLIQNDTSEGPLPPAITGSRARITPPVQQLITALAAAGLVRDQTTPATVTPDVWAPVTLGSGWAAYDEPSTPRCMLNYDNTVSVEGRLDPPASVPAGSVMFTVPLGYRPPVNKFFTSVVNTSGGVANVMFYASDGTVKLWDFASTPTSVLLNARYSLTP